MDQMNFLIEQFHQSVARHGNSIAVTHNDRSLSYIQLDQRSTQIAEQLEALGVVPSDRIAICMSRGADACALVLAVLKLGAAYVPLDPGYPADRLAMMADDCRPSVLVAQQKYRELFKGDHKIINFESIVDQLEASKFPNRVFEPSPDSIAYLIYTSGSTGIPKGVAMPMSALGNLIAWQLSQPEFIFPAKTLQFTPLSFDVHFQEFFTTWISGGELIVIDDERRRDTPRLVEFINHYKVGRLFLPFVALQNIAEYIANNQNRCPLSLTQVITAGEQLRVDRKLRSFFSALPDCALYNQYGPSESHVVTCFKLAGNPKDWPPLPSIGSAIDGAELIVVNDKGQPTTEEGELLIGGVCLAEGYWERPGLNQDKFIDLVVNKETKRFYRSGDLVRQEKGSNYTYLGRIDGQVKIRGNRVETGEVEAAICRNPAVSACSVIANESEHGERQLLAYLSFIVPKTGQLDSSRQTAHRSDGIMQQVRSSLEKDLPDYMQPARLIEVQSLPLTPSGKVDKQALPLPSRDRPSLEQEFVAPTSTTEIALAKIWEGLLGLDRVGIHDTFFELGGSSLLALKVNSQIASQLHKEVPITTLFELPTISRLAQYIDHGSERDGSSKNKPLLSCVPNENNICKGIAIVGMSCQFPGAETIDEFWENLCNGKESITRFTAEEMIAAGVDPNTASSPNYVGARGLINNPNHFDATFFGISPNEAKLIDPQQRIFLESCWHAMESAGYKASTNSNVGVWGGVSTGMTHSTYMLSNLYSGGSGLKEEDTITAMLGNAAGYLTTRVSYKLNLHGPSINVQTACSTSLVAVAQACQSLMTYGCDMALAGGVSVSYPQQEGYSVQEGDIGSPDAHCRPFDAKAAGTIFSNGVGVVALKRLEDAVADNDHIYAVIKSAALNNDGAGKVSFAAPSIDGQANVIAKAHALANIDSRSITYIEAHGTATPLGDPIEVAALGKAFGDASIDKQYCGLGSVKSNFGHLESAAGVAALIKTALCLYHKKLVPTLHYESPNPNINFADSPFYVCDRLNEWDTDQLPRRAGVSGFGIGGTNAHLIVEEAPPRASINLDQESLLLLSAKNENALRAAAKNLGTYIENNPAASLTDIAFTLREGREHFKYRLSVTGNESSRTELARALKRFDRKQLSLHKSLPADGEVVFMFPGGGAQYHGMGRDLYENDVQFRASVDRGLAIYLANTGTDLKAIWFADEDSADHAQEELQRPSIQLPAIFILEIALAEYWQGLGIDCKALIGHSLGENTAACLAGILSYEDALGLVTLRGQLFETVTPGGMLSVSLSADEADKYLSDRLDLATVNGPEQVTISGDREALMQLQRRFEKDNIDAQVIPIDIAAHSYLLEPILQQFGDYLRGVNLSPPKIPIISNKTGTWLSNAEAVDPEYWVQHLRSTVRFADGIALLSENANRTYLEVGPGKVLSSLAKLNVPEQANQAVSSMRHRQENIDDVTAIHAALGSLWAIGVVIDFETAINTTQGQRIELPLYPFQRKSYFMEPRAAAQNTVASLQPLELPNLASAQEFATNLDTSQMAANSPSDRSEIVFVDRKTYILGRLRETIHDMSGLDLDDIGDDTSFLDMGFDSLFLTQVNLRFKKEFKVRITFRQLFEEAPNIQSLATYIDEQLPENALSDKLSVEVLAGNTASSALEATGALGMGMGQAPAQNHTAMQINPQELGDSPLQQALALQVQASNALMALLAGGLPNAQAQQPIIPSTQASTLPAAVKVNDQTSATGTSNLNISSANNEDNDDAFEAKGFGPWRPLDQGRGGLDDRARAELNKFIEAYSQRTIKSKQLANEQRPHLSDARSISGFRQDWKEMVYQIAGAGSKGTKIWDVDGNEYIDFTSGFGSNIIGYAPEPVVEAIKQQAEEGFELGTLSPKASEAAKIICDITGMDRVTFTNTGSESLTAACRSARTITGKDRIAVFLNEYHGIADELLVNLQKFKSGKSKTVPTSPGIPQFLVENVLVLEWDDPHYMEKLREQADDIAGVIIEPVQSRNPGFHTYKYFKEMREFTLENNIALIFDEMITGFRLAPGGAQEYFDIEVDMVCYGKIVSSGTSLSVLAGRGEYLDCFDGGPWQFGDSSFPEAGVTFFGGTYTRHPLALAATLAGLKLIQELTTDDYQQLNERSAKLNNELNEVLIAAGFPAKFESQGSILELEFNDNNPFSRLFFWYMRHQGIMIYDRPIFIQMAHTEADLQKLVEAVATSVDQMQAAGIVPAVTIDNYYGGSQEVGFTDAQQEVWLTSLLGDDASRAYNEQVIYEMDTRLDLYALRHAMQKVAYRHEALRSTIIRDGEGFVIHPSMFIPVDEIDLRDETDEATAESKRACSEAQIDQVFDIFEGPLLKVKLARTGENKSMLIVTGHHLIFDGWSTGVVLDDLSTYYLAALRCERFGSVADDQLSGFNRMQQDPEIQEEQLESEEYWLKQFAADIPMPPALPTDFPRPAIKTYNGHRLGRVVSENLYKAISDFSSQSKCTMFTSLFSVFSIWISKLTAQSDLVIGIPVAGQAMYGCPTAIGHMVNYLPFRVTVDPDELFTSYLEKVRSYVLDCNDHQTFTYGSLLRKIELSRDHSQMPLTSISFNVDQGMTSFNFGEIDARYVISPRNFVKYDMFFNVLDEGNGLSLEVDYNSDLFNEATINTWIDQFEQLLSSVVEQSQSRIADFTSSNKKDIAMLKDQQVNVDNKFLDTVAAFPTAFSVVAASFPDKVALLDAHNTTTYAELDRQSNRFANYLIANGVNRGDYVAVVLPRNIDMVAALLAVMKAGAVYVPIAPDYPAARVNYMLDQSACSAVLSYEEYRGMLPQSTAVSIMLDSDLAAISAASSASTNITVDNQDLAYVIFTSGSTGEPKGVQISHGAMINFLRSMQAEPGFAEDDRLLAITTLSFDISVLELYLPLLVGGSVVIADQNLVRDGQGLADTIVRKNITVLQATPSTWQLLLLADWQGAPHLKALCGGEAMPSNLVEQLLPKVGELWNMYGPTETTVWSTCKKISDAHESISIGSPIQNTTCYILDQQLAPVASGSVGELYIGGLGVAHGYLGQPELTAERFLPDPFAGDSRKMYRTGDLACRNQQGLLQHKGRTDHQVKVRGFRIELGEIEHEINKLDVVQECVVVVREDRTDEKSLVAYVTLTAGGKLDLPDLRDFLGQALPSYMLPSAVVSLDTFPLTPNEKIDRRALPQPSKNHGTVDVDLPKTEGEVYLAAIWSELLADDTPIYVNDNFFDIGGHSLLAAKVCARVRKERGVDIPVMNLITGTLGQVVKVFIDSQVNTGLSSVGSSAAAANEPKQRSMLSRLFRR